MASKICDRFSCIVRYYLVRSEEYYKEKYCKEYELVLLCNQEPLSVLDISRPFIYVLPFNVLHENKNYRILCVEININRIVQAVSVNVLVFMEMH